MSITGIGFKGLSLWLSLAGLGAQTPDTGLKIEVHIYNYSKVSPEMLVRAEQETARIFERIGVATTWLVCPLTSQEAVRNRACALPSAPTRFTLRLLSNSMADSLGVGGDIFESARLPQKEGFGVVADVYADRTRELADRREFEVILGWVIAHELGHLLLGKNAHSAAGIMHARWRAQDLGISRQAAMLFLPGEAKRIHAQVIARTVGQLSLTSVELPISNLTAASSQIFAHEPGSSTAPAERLNIHLGSPEAKLVVRLYDYAQVPSRVLTRAEHEAARVFQIVGIQLSWVECGPSEADKERFLNCEHVTDPLGLYLTVIPQHMAAWFQRPHRFGTSFGMRAVVFHHQVEETARNENFSQGLILGCVMAHELGHLLLGENSHGQGIMTGTFGRSDFVSAEKGELVFTPDQAEQMRARISVHEECRIARYLGHHRHRPEGHRALPGQNG